MLLLELGHDDVVAWPQQCVLCDWTTQDPATEQLAEDDGISFEQAQENVRLHAWMYDPAQPPEWMTLPPNADELAARRHLVDVFEQIETQSQRGFAADDLWNEAKATEDTIRELAHQREHDSEAGAREEMGPDDDGELPNDLLLSP